MRSDGRVRRCLVVLVTALTVLVGSAAMPGAALAARVRQSDGDVTIGSDETVRDDLYVFGSAVDIEGRVEGDVIAFASVVTIDGEVTGDVIAGSSDVSISGNVGGSVRAGSGTISVTGSIGEDLVAGSGRLRVGSDATIGRDVVAGTGEMRIDGGVARNLLIGAGDVTLGGQVGGDADIGSPRIRFDGGRIAGDLTYRSDERQDIPEDAVGGEITFRETPAAAEDTAATSALAWFLSWIRGLVAFALLTLVVTLIFPLYSLTAAEEIRIRPLPSVGIGLAVFFGVPFAATFVFVIGILVGGWWLGLALMALYLIALAVAVVLTAVFVGGWLLGLMKRTGVRAVWAGLFGLLVIWLVRLIPILGTFALWVAMLFGLGAGILAMVDTARRCRPPAPTVTAEEPLV